MSGEDGTLHIVSLNGGRGLTNEGGGLSESFTEPLGLSRIGTGDSAGVKDPGLAIASAPAGLGVCPILRVTSICLFSDSVEAGAGSAELIVPSTDSDRNPFSGYSACAWVVRANGIGPGEDTGDADGDGRDWG